MTKIYTFVLSLVLFTVSSPLSAADGVQPLTDDNVSEISQRLQGYSTEQLIERRNYIINVLDDEDDEDSSGAPIPTDRAALLFELSVIEQLLIIAGVVLADSVTSESSTPPDTVFPVITIL